MSAEMERDARVLARHWWMSRGMTSGSADTCSCGERTYPERGDAEISERRAVSFARHQARMLDEVRQIVAEVTP